MSWGLKIKAPQMEPFTYVIQGPETTIGRSALNEVVVFDRRLSRQHLRLMLKGGRLYGRDLNSKNGTFWNDNILDTEKLLSPGDFLQAGNTRIEIFRKLETQQKLEISSSMTGQPTLRKIRLAEHAKELPAGLFQKEKHATQEELLAKNRYLTVLNRAALALLEESSLEQVLEKSMDLSFEAIPAVERGYLLLRQDGDDDLQPQIVRHRNQNGGQEKFIISRSILDEVVKQQCAVKILDAQHDPRFENRESIIASGVRAAICAPIWNRGEVMGIIYLDSHEGLYRFDDAALGMLTSLANMVGMKIQMLRYAEHMLEKRRMEQELAIASEIQNGLLPQKTPEFEGYTIRMFGESCYEVGGDYYNLTTTPKGNLMITIADVTGKGTGAALLMASLHAAVQVQKDDWDTPARFCQKLNQFIFESTAPNKYITACFVWLHPDSNELTYINAGHNPALLIAKKKKPQELGASGFALGMFAAGEYTQQTTKMDSGNILSIYTDGFEEITNPDGVEYGKDRIVRLLKKISAYEEPEFDEAMEDEIKQFAGGDGVRDDISLITVKRL